MSEILEATMRPSGVGHPETVSAHRWRMIAMIGLGLVVFAIALTFIRHELANYSLTTIVSSLKTLTLVEISLAILATAVSFAAISVYDSLALRYTDKHLSLRRTGFASACAFAVSNTLGFSALTGNAVRYRLYTSWGLGALDIAVIALVTSGFLFLSGLILASTGLILEASAFALIFHLDAPLAAGLGLIGIIIVLSAMTILLRGPEVRTVRRVQLHRPPVERVGLQLGIGMIDWIASAAVLYFLLPHGPEFSFLAFVPIFVAAHYIGAASGLPGGVGVFEAIFLLLVPSSDTVAVAAGLVAYRAVYYILPLIIAVLALAVDQGFRSREKLAASGEVAEDFVEALAPTLYALMSFIAGTVMLLSAATPEIYDRLTILPRYIPSSLMEVSHLAASAVGTILLITAVGLRKRLHNAWRLAIGLFTAGAVFTVLKGGDPKGGIFLIVLAGSLWLSRQAFYRQGRLADEPLTPGRLGSMLGAAGFALWMGFYAYSHRDYSADLWWEFGQGADASRFLRSAALVGIVLSLYFIWRLIQPAPKPHQPDDEAATMERVRAAIAGAEHPTAEANLALIGDKKFLFSPSGQSFIMYGVKGRNWVAMGEPVGLHSEKRDLLWAFRQLADASSAWPSFYSVRGASLADYVDIGLTVQKIGETALVPIQNFTLEGSDKAKLRQARNRAIREGCSFEVIYPKKNSDDMSALEAVSVAWLRDHQGKEKRFSLGFFDPETLHNRPVAVIKKDEEIVAFANLWTTSDKSELSLDLMRYRDCGVNGIMDYLFVEIMLWASGQDYGYFSLGMAPLSGIESHRLAPFMSKLGRIIFKYGGKVYGFEGLRSFKQKFNPVWVPVYLAAPSQLVMPQALGNLALLSSGGILGLLQREK